MSVVEYGFPAWCKENVPAGTRPTAVQAYFARRGLRLSREAWRKLLRPTPAAIRLSTWTRICDVTSQPLETFLRYQPDDRPQTAALEPDPSPVTSLADNSPVWNPPNPFRDAP